MREPLRGDLFQSPAPIRASAAAKSSAGYSRSRSSCGRGPAMPGSSSAQPPNNQVTAPRWCRNATVSQTTCRSFALTRGRLPAGQHPAVRDSRRQRRGQGDLAGGDPAREVPEPIAVAGHLVLVSAGDRPHSNRRAGVAHPDAGTRPQTRPCTRTLRPPRLPCCQQCLPWRRCGPGPGRAPG